MFESDLELLVYKIEDHNKAIWPERTKPTQEAYNGLCCALLQETGELSQAIRNHLGRPYAKYVPRVETKKFMEEEWGDAMSVLICIAQAFGLDKEKALADANKKLINLRLKMQEDARWDHMLKQDNKGKNV